MSSEVVDQNFTLYRKCLDEVREELEEMLRPRGDVLMTCLSRPYWPRLQPALIGDLDPKQKLTFDLVCERGETDAGGLMKEYGESEGVKQTAWNNRLVSLAALGLVVEDYSRALQAL